MNETLNPPAPPATETIKINGSATAVRLSVVRESAYVAGIGYDSAAQALYVKHNDGKLYVYAQVPPAVFRDALAAESKGRYVLRQVKDRYPHQLYLPGQFVRVAGEATPEQLLGHLPYSRYIGDDVPDCWLA